MAFLITSPEISTAFAKIFSNPNPSPQLLKSLTISKNYDDSIWSRAKVRLGVKDIGATVLGSNQSLRLYGQFSAPVKQGSKPSKEEDEKQNYYLNMGYAIRTLREEFPDLFYRELSFDIYRDDIVFKDPLNTFVGIDNYKSIFWALRFHGRIFFKALWLDIISVWQPVENVIMVRWTVHGIPRVPWERRGRFDGISEYKLDKNGKIFEHRVDNIALNSPPKFHVLAVEDIIRSIGCPSTPRPTYFEISSSSSHYPERT
ncbi:hypothetical protein PTKIN_Ptkin15bG0048000 [Pterospermum kingtungense]